MRRVSELCRPKVGFVLAEKRVSSRARSTGRVRGPTSRIHLRRPSSSQVPPQSPQVSTGMVAYSPSFSIDPQPEHHTPSVPPPTRRATRDGTSPIYGQKPCPARLSDDRSRVSAGWRGRRGDDGPEPAHTGPSRAVRFDSP